MASAFPRPKAPSPRPTVLVAGAAAGAIAHSGSAELEKAMTAASNYVKQKYCSAHHIVAQDDPRAAASRLILANVGMSINNAADGVYLHSMYHDRIYTNPYYSAAYRNLSGAQKYVEVALPLSFFRMEINAGIFPF